MLSTVKEEKVNIDMDSCASTVNLVVDETLDTVDTNFINQSCELINETSNEVHNNMEHNDINYLKVKNEKIMPHL